MAYNVWFDKEPGRYTAAQTVNWVVSDQVNFFALSQGNTPASISEYIAYDTLTPPGPFIAVTQDGTGNVVYDGGFPKFYNSSAPPSGINPSITMEFKATNDGTATSGNAYYYNAFSDLPVTIAAGDKFVYDMLQDSATAVVGLDAVTANAPGTAAYNYSMRDWGKGGGVIKDQNGILIHPSSDLGGRAVNQWYHREFDLSPCAGSTFIKWSMAYEGETPGTFATRFRDVYILDSTGKIKAILFKDVMRLPGNSSAEVGASGYTNLSKTTYDPRGQLTASFKYLFNAVNWTANPAKVTAGIKKILILGDMATGAYYAVKSTQPNSFFTSLTNLCAAAGYTPTFKDTSDYAGGYLDPTLAELNSYCCVLVMGSVGGGTALITDAGVSNLVAARAAGLGIILITDDGPDISTIGGAYPPPQVTRQFFVTVNKIAVQFGAWFTGNYDRTPVNVGFLRSTYGDHPLYGGMLDSESIQAGGSESKVMITPFTKYGKTALPAPLQFTALGRYIVQVTAKLKDGTSESFRVVFIIGNGNVIQWTLDGANEVTAIDLQWAWNASLIVGMDTIGLGTLQGSIYQNAKKVGELSSTDAGGPVVTWYTGDSYGLRLKHGDVLKAALETPLQATANIAITRNNLVGVKGHSLAEVTQRLRSSWGLSAAGKAVKSAAKLIVSLLPSGAQIPGFGGVIDASSPAQQVRLVREFSNDNFPLSPTTALIYGTTAALNAALASKVPTTPLDIFNTWARFSAANYYPSGTTPPTGSSAADWVWDASANSANMPTNTSEYVGLVSKELVENYVLGVTLSSSNSDDDSICVIIASRFNGTLETLSLVINPGGTLRPALNLVYNYTLPTQKILASNSALVQAQSNDGSGGWSNHTIRAQVTRRGGSLSMVTTGWNAVAAGWVNDTRMSFDMTSDPVLANLLGPQQYGYGAFSQPSTVFKDISFSGGALNNVIADVVGNKVYRYNGSAWVVIAGLSIADLYGVNRTVTSSETGAAFHINADGSITAL